MQSNKLQKNSETIVFDFNKLGLGVFLYAYATFLGACYLFAFWRPIGFNIFPYLTAQDYISASLNRLTILIAVPLIFSAFIFLDEETKKGRSTYVFAYLAIMYCIAFFVEFYKAASSYLGFNFYFTNENSAIAIAALIFAAGMALSIYSCVKSTTLTIQIAGLILVQSSGALAAGYSDGKTIYNGAMQVHFLDNKELCESDGVRDWVLLGSFGSRTFFMNTIDKRLCITEQKNMRLVSRQVQDTH